MVRRAACIIACLAVPLAALADGGLVAPPQAAAMEAAQRAIILEGPNRDYFLILQIAFSGDAREFGWIIPVPTDPGPNGIAKADEWFWRLVWGRATPRVTTRLDRYQSMGKQAAGVVPPPATAGGGPPQPPVQVIRTVDVGPYRATVLRAWQAGALEAWLRKHGFSLPPDAQPALEPYIKKRWHFIALKLSRTASRPELAHLPPLSIHYRFPPHKFSLLYPLTISRLSSREWMTLDLCVIARSSVRCREMPAAKPRATRSPCIYDALVRATAGGRKMVLLAEVPMAGLPPDALPFDGCTVRWNWNNMWATHLWARIPRSKLRDLTFMGLLCVNRWRVHFVRAPRPRSPLGAKLLALGAVAVLIALILAVRTRRLAALILAAIFTAAATATLAGFPAGATSTQWQRAAAEIGRLIDQFKAQLGGYPVRISDLWADNPPAQVLDESGNIIPAATPSRWPIVKSPDVVPPDPITGRRSTWRLDLLAPNHVTSTALRLTIEDEYLEQPRPAPELVTAAQPPWQFRWADTWVKVAEYPRADQVGPATFVKMPTAGIWLAPQRKVWLPPLASFGASWELAAGADGTAWTVIPLDNPPGETRAWWRAIYVSYADVPNRLDGIAHGWPFAIDASARQVLVCTADFPPEADTTYPPLTSQYRTWRAEMPWKNLTARLYVGRIGSRLREVTTLRSLAAVALAGPDAAWTLTYSEQIHRIRLSLISLRDGSEIAAATTRNFEALGLSYPARLDWSGRLPTFRAGDVSIVFVASLQPVASIVAVAWLPSGAKPPFDLSSWRKLASSPSGSLYAKAIFSFPTPRARKAPAPAAPDSFESKYILFHPTGPDSGALALRGSRGVWLATISAGRAHWLACVEDITLAAPTYGGPKLFAVAAHGDSVLALIVPEKQAAGNAQLIEISPNPPRALMWFRGNDLLWQQQTVSVNVQGAATIKARIVGRMPLPLLSGSELVALDSPGGRPSAMLHRPRPQSITAAPITVITAHGRKVIIAGTRACDKWTPGRIPTFSLADFALVLKPLG